MTAEFRSRFGAAIHGRYSVDGNSFIYQHPVHSPRRRQGIELHEWVHSELLDNTAYGTFQRMLDLVTRVARAGSFEKRCRKVLASSLRSCSVLHEGLGAYRELCWLASNEGGAAAREYLQALPDFYRVGVDRVTRLVGDPLDAPYQGMTPPQMHTLLVTLGIGLLNPPVLDEYAEPERIREDPLTWVLLDGPDQRFAALDDHAAAVASVLASLASEPLLSTAVETLATQKDATLLMRFWDLGVETLRGAIGGMPMLTRAEAAEQTEAFDRNWLSELRRLSDVEIRSGRPGRDISAERSLAMAVYPSDYAHHEAARAQQGAARVDLGWLSRAMRGRGAPDALPGITSPNVVHLAFIACVGPDVPRGATLMDAPASLLAVPMRSASTGSESPWASFIPTHVADTTIGEIVEHSAALAPTAWCWYTNQTIVQFLRELDRLPQGLLFERCSNAADVLADLALARHGGRDADGFFVEVFAQNEALVAIVFSGFVSFSIATEMGRRSFEDAARNAGLAWLAGRALRIGGRDIAIEVAVRWLRWGALGS